MTMTSNSLEQACSLGSVVHLRTLVIYQRQPLLMLATLIRMISGFRWSFTHHVATGDTGDYYLGMPYKNPEAQREWQRSHREDTPAKRAHRREYERNARTVNVLRLSFSYLNQNVLKGLNVTRIVEQRICVGAPRVTRTVVYRSLALIHHYLFRHRTCCSLQVVPLHQLM